MLGTDICPIKEVSEEITFGHFSHIEERPKDGNKKRKDKR